MSVDDGLRSLFRKNISDAHWQTIERLLDRGVPDSNVCVDGSDVWIEFKATRKWYVRMRPEQVGWLLARERRGGRTVIAVRRRMVAGSPLTDQLWMIRGSAAAYVQDHGIKGLAGVNAFLGMWEGGPRRWDWSEIREILFYLNRRGEME